MSNTQDQQQIKNPLEFQYEPDYKEVLTKDEFIDFITKVINVPDEKGDVTVNRQYIELMLHNLKSNPEILGQHIPKYIEDLDRRRYFSNHTIITGEDEEGNPKESQHMTDKGFYYMKASNLLMKKHQTNISLKKAIHIEEIQKRLSNSKLTVL